MSKNVAVFVDVANIFYAAKAAGVDIDYVTLLKTASAGRDLVRAYAYTGLDPDNENQRNFHEFLRRHGYKVVSKDIRKYGDGKVKANLDIELVVDMMKTARNLDIAIVISGDGDFAPAIRAVQEMGVRVEVISFRGNTSSDLIEVADLFTEITQIARVEKGSSRSGRRVADDEEDLSMTEVPDKQSEGTGPRGRGRGRGRTRTPEGEVAVAVAPAPRSRSRARVVESDVPAVAAVAAGGIPMVVMPGEKLSRVAAVAAPVAPVAPVAAPEDSEKPDDLPAGEPQAEGEGEDGAHRRRRRRGGRGRGRGRGRDEAGTPVEGGVAGAGDAVEADDIEDEELEQEIAPARGPAKRSTHSFGSVWDSQIGVPSGTPIPAAASGPLDFEDDLDEPPIPEYLIAERQGRDGNRGGGAVHGGRGTRGSYAAAVDRERYGGARGGGSPRFAEPAPRSGGRGGEGSRGGNGSRGGDASRGGDRFRSDRPAPRTEVRSGSTNEPWSEVPPEIEAMLRAQLGTRTQRPVAPAPRAAEPTASEAPASEPAVKAPATRRPARKVATAAGSVTTEPKVAPAVEETAPAAPKRRAVRKPAEAATAVAPSVADANVAETTASRRRTTRKAVEADGPAASAADATPKRRSTRKLAPAADA